MSNLPKLLQDLKNARQEVRNLTVMAMRPDLLPSKEGAHQVPGTVGAG
jgi:hypothetical protein